MKKMVEETKPRIMYKSVDDALVAYIRFLGHHEDIPAHFDRLRKQVGQYIAGDPICLYDRSADDRPPKEYHIEVCYPVSQAVENGEIKSKTLQGGRVISVISPLPQTAPWGRAKWWETLGATIHSNYLRIDEDPLREIRYMENGVEVSELQAVLQFPRWLEGLSKGLQENTNEEIRCHVMEGSEHLRAESPIQERLAWVQAAIQRLDADVPDPHLRRCILKNCADHYPPARIEYLRHTYQQLRDVDALLEVMRQDVSGWYGDLIREGNIIYTIVHPASAEAHAKARTEKERRLAACYCPLIRAAIKYDKPISPTFCNCSVGFNTQLWEGIFQRPLRVEMVESVLRGDPHCKFVTRLPEEIDRE